MDVKNNKKNKMMIQSSNPLSRTPNPIRRTKAKKQYILKRVSNDKVVAKMVGWKIWGWTSKSLGSQWVKAMHGVKGILKTWHTRDA